MSYIRTLAVDPTTKGFCYALLEGSERLLSWGCVELKPKGSEMGARVRRLVEDNLVQLLVTEDPILSRRRARARRRIQAALDVAVERDLLLWMVSREDVAEEFQASGTTRYEIATALTRQFPELRPKLPRKRKPWESDAERLNVFDALSFALTALSKVERQGI